MSRWLLYAPLCLALACIGDTDVPPPTPTLLDVTTPTTVPRQTLAGGKQRGTAVLNFGEVIVEHDDSPNWSFDLLLQPGENLISLTAQSPGGKESRRAVEAVIVYEPPCPPSPTLEPVVSPTNVAAQTLTGSKPPASSLELWTLDAAGGVVTTVEVEPFGDTTTWSYELTVASDGPSRYAVVAEDADGKVSEPERFEIELDTADPTVAVTFPADTTTAVPVDSAVEITFDGPLGIDAMAPPSTAVAVTAGGPLAGALRYYPLSHTLAFLPATDLPADTVINVALSAADLPDAAGNVATSLASFSFTTGAASGAPAPAMAQVTAGDDSPTTARAASLEGTKDAGSSIWINNVHAVPLDDTTTWSVDWPLDPGRNDLVVVAKGANGAAGPAATPSIVRDLVKPLPPSLEPAPPGAVTEPAVAIGGGKDPDTAILINGAVAVCRTPEDAWGADVPLLPGPNDIEIRARNADGVVSDPILVSVDFTQSYQGQVPAEFWLQVSLDLRDLSNRVGMFDEGPNMYSLDIWLEGPLDSGEVCQIDSGSFERQNLTDPPLTLVHYQGATSTATNPFTMADYRAPDYIAALVASGSIPGVSPSSDRRDANGRTGLALPTSAVDDVDETCFARSSLSIDGCTEATRDAGIHSFEWPLLDPSSQRIEQGEYLLNILINLDRQPLWAGANDTETCWADTSYATRGPHRIVRRLSLGSQAYTVPLSPLSESSGADPDPTAEDGQLRYVGAAGGRIIWGPR